MRIHASAVLALLFASPAYAQLNPQPNSLMFPDTGVGAQSPAQTITYTNAGGQLTVQQINLAGANPGDFVLGNAPQLPVSLAMNASLAFSVTFKPGSPGARSAQIALVTNGNNPAPVPLSGNALGPKLQVTPNPINCGGVKLNTSTKPLSVTVSNAGGGQLTVMSLMLSGGNAAEFKLASVPNLPIKLGPNGNFMFTVTLTPQMAAMRSTTLVVASDDPNNPMLSVTVVGSGGNPMISLDVGTVAFGNQRVGIASPAQTVTVSNPGGADLHVQSATLAGANAQDFQLSMLNLPATVLPGASLQFAVAFKPTAVGARTGQIVVMSDDPNSPTKLVTLQGSGTTSNLGIAPPMLDFGKQRILSASLAQSVTISNPGNDAANLLAVMLGGMNPTWFAVTNQPGLPAPIPSQGALTLGVIADPLALGPGTATLMVMTDDPKMPLFQVPLAVNGVGGALGFSPNFVDFGPVALAQTATQAVMIQNTGTDVVTVNTLTLDGPNADVFAITEMVMLPLTIQPMNSFTFHVTFKPAVMQQHQATITLTSDDPRARVLKLPLDGSGAMLGIMVSPMSIDFHSVPLGTTASAMQVGITNTGAPLTISTVQVVGANATSFTVDAAGPIQLDANGTKNLNVGFTAMSAGPAQAQLVITPMGLTPIMVSLKGTGVSPMFGVGPTALDFLAVNLGTPSTPQTVSMKNAGSSPVMISSITSSDSQFQISTTGTKLTLAGGEQSTFAVTFAPQTVGQKNATITVNLVAGAPATITATGVGVNGVVKRPQPGCSLSGPPRSRPGARGAMASVLALALFAAVVTRRRRVT